MSQALAVIAGLMGFGLFVAWALGSPDLHWFHWATLLAAAAVQMRWPIKRGDT